jgi:hypothetical protein
MFKRRWIRCTDIISFVTLREILTPNLFRSGDLPNGVHSLLNSDSKVNISSSLSVVRTLIYATYLNFCFVNDVVSLLEAGIQFIFKAGNLQSRLSASAETLNCGGIRRADEKLPAKSPHLRTAISLLRNISLKMSPTWTVLSLHRLQLHFLRVTDWLTN